MLASERLEEWKKWYFEHKDTHMPLEKKVEFLQKNVEGLYELLSAMIERTSEGRKKSAVLYTPRGLTYVS